jgi:cellulose synthase/poly-beta-1,6-N-acetylglucosamine synthase-like glycosyltransferase
MDTIKILFWIMLFVVFYTYIGYGIVLYLLVRIKRRYRKDKVNLLESPYEPDVTLLIPAYNEKDYVAKKMQNTWALDYPKDKLKICWVTDGSDDGTADFAQSFDGVNVYHLPKREGKINAINRVMPFVTTPIVVFSDANTQLGKESIKRIVKCFNNPKVGCVSGEKRIINKEKDAAVGAGEGIYWHYESTLKKWDAELYSVVGAAGELFAIRTELFTQVEADTILDDFIISLRVAQKGYTIGYDPEAYAIEHASLDVKEEMKRKIRISAGGIQSVVRLRSLLNIFKYRTLSFQYISHRVLRWTITPLCLLLLLTSAIFLGASEGIMGFGLYSVLFWLHLLFYAAALLGRMQENKQTKLKALFVPYYFLVMNYSVLLGFYRFIGKNQSVNWERAKRAK